MQQNQGLTRDAMPKKYQDYISITDPNHHY